MATRVRCYTRRVSAQEWEGLCLDYDIAVTGRSRREVGETLDAAIHSYVEDACKEAPRDRDRLLRRKSPLLLRLSVQWSAYRNRLADEAADEGADHQHFPSHYCPV
jgi:hypothetical protein